jgi:hypothetical protein
VPHTFTAYEKLINSKHVQVAMMGEHGLAWPSEILGNFGVALRTPRSHNAGVEGSSPSLCTTNYSGFRIKL